MGHAVAECGVFEAVPVSAEGYSPERGEAEPADLAWVHERVGVPVTDH